MAALTLRYCRRLKSLRIIGCDILMNKDLLDLPIRFNTGERGDGPHDGAQSGFLWHRPGSGEPHGEQFDSRHIDPAWRKLFYALGMNVRAA